MADQTKLKSAEMESTSAVLELAKNQQKVQVLVRLMRNQLETAILFESMAEAYDRKKERQGILSRQRKGKSLLPDEQAVIDQFKMKPEGPERNLLTRCYNRISNARKLEKLCREDQVSLIDEKLAAARKKFDFPLTVKPIF